MGRKFFPKNTASAAEIANLLRAKHPDCDAANVPPSEEHVAEKYQNVIKDLLMWTPRLNVKLLAEATRQAYKIEEAAGLRFARAITDCVSSCRGKAKSVTSGKKQSKAMYSIQTTLRSLQSDALKRQLWSGTRQLTRRLSEESGTKKCQPTLASSVKGGPLLDPSSIMRLYGVSGAAQTDSDTLIVSSASEAGEFADESEGSHLPLASAKPASGMPAYFDASKHAMVRVAASGMVEVADMAEGPDGFAVATFKDGCTVVTECPNLLLAQPLAQMQVRKRPARAAGADDSEEDSAIEEQPVMKKRPAASKPSGTVCRRPAALERKGKATASTPSAPAPEAAGVRFRYPGKPEDAEARQPNGCSRCRFVAGCTNSCWKRRWM